MPVDDTLSYVTPLVLIDGTNAEAPAQGDSRGEKRQRNWNNLVPLPWCRSQVNLIPCDNWAWMILNNLPIDIKLRKRCL